MRLQNAVCSEFCIRLKYVEIRLSKNDALKFIEFLPDLQNLD